MIKISTLTILLFAGFFVSMKTNTRLIAPIAVESRAAIGSVAQQLLHAWNGKREEF